MRQNSKRHNQTTRSKGSRVKSEHGSCGATGDISTKKELGQNFLFDEASLNQIVDYGELSADDTVLEIGPGMGPLTARLLQRAGHVTAVEFDQELAGKLRDNVVKQITPHPWSRGDQCPPHEGEGLDTSTQSLSLEERVGEAAGFPGRGEELLDNLEVINADFLTFNLNALPKDYKVVANIPYNITSKIVEKLWTAENKPSLVVLLVQKEVAERLAAQPGQLSVLAISAQIFSEVSLGIKVPAELFIPAPKVDSQVVIMWRRDQPLVQPDNLEQFFYVVKSGFSEKRKKLRSSLAVGLRTSKTEAERLLADANIDPNKRAQELTIDEWKKLSKV